MASHHVALPGKRLRATWLPIILHLRQSVFYLFLILGVVPGLGRERRCSASFERFGARPTGAADLARIGIADQDVPG